MNREIPASSELLPQETVLDHHGLVELKEVKEIINGNILLRGETVGDAETVEQDKERMAFTHALVWLLQGKQWLEEDENTGKTLEDFMLYKELDYQKKWENEESEAVRQNLSKNIHEFQDACDIIRGGIKLREKE